MEPQQTVRNSGARRIRGEGTSERRWLDWLSRRALPAADPISLLAGKARAVVVAPHPDDEVIAVGGLLSRLARLGTAIELIAVTDGTASHPASTQWPSQRLARVRPEESRQALRRLGIATEPVRLGFGDGRVCEAEPFLAERLFRLLHRDDAVFTTWCFDGHPDHEATARACAAAASACGARLLQVPVWAWHWAQPGDPGWPWLFARRLALDDEAIQRKRDALLCFTSQLESDPSTGAPPILGQRLLERSGRPFEVLFTPPREADRTADSRQCR